MAKLPADPRNHPAAEVSIEIGKSVAFGARITAAGLFAVGALVTGILLSTAVIVRTAKRDETKRLS